MYKTNRFMTAQKRRQTRWTDLLVRANGSP